LNRFKNTLALSGFPISKAQSDLKDIKQVLAKDAENYLSAKKWEIFQYHSKENSFYKSLLNNSEVSSWEDIPILEKQDLQIPLEQRLSNNYRLKDVYVSKTSGSSGHPFSYAVDKYAHALTWSTYFEFYKQYDIRIGQSYEARFYGMPKEPFPHLKERVKDKIINRFRFNIFDLSEEKLSLFLQKFKTTAFDYMNGYTSSIVRFAKFLNAKGVVLKEVCPSLKVCITTSEMLFDSDRTLLVKQLGIPVVNEYGASESGIIAFENPNLEWRLNLNTLYVEVVDDNGKVLDYGNKGNILITSLYNKAHPFIRYKIGDIGAIDDKNLLSLNGRTNEFAILPSGKVVPALTFYYVTKSAIENNGLVKEMMVKQIRQDTFDIIYVAEQQLSAAQITKICKAVEDYLEPQLQLNFKRQDVIIRAKNGKLKQFVSEI
jgi:phenylacetate-CoA ligase